MKTEVKDIPAKRLRNFRARCQMAHLRITPQRVAVYEQLVKSKAHPSANMVYRRICKKFPNISLDTVNRTLLTLVELGLAVVVPSSSRAKRFDAAVGPHQHFRCVKCGKIIDFHCADFDNITLPVGIRRKFTVLSKTVYFEGICDRCSTKKRS